MKVLLVGASPSGSAPLVARLAAEHDRVIAVDGGGALCAEAGITPERLVGDFDSLSASVLRELETRGALVERHPAEKDETDLVLALQSARLHGAHSVTLTAVLGARPDHTLAGLGAVASFAQLRPMIREADVSAAVLGDGGARACRVSSSSATFSAIAVAGEGCVSITGARWPLDHALLSPLGTLGVSNVVTEGSALVRLHSGIIIVFAPTVDGLTATLEYED